jgi:hypothetical protein
MEIKKLFRVLSKPLVRLLATRSTDHFFPSSKVSPVESRLIPWQAFFFVLVDSCFGGGHNKRQLSFGEAGWPKKLSSNRNFPLKKEIRQSCVGSRVNVMIIKILGDFRRKNDIPQKNFMILFSAYIHM